MEIAWVAPGATVCTPEGDTVPFAPEDTEMVNPTVQEPEERQKGFAGSLLAHCAFVVQAAHEFVAWLQMGAVPLHWLSAVQAKQLPDASHQGCEAFFALHCPFVAHATHEPAAESQIGVMPVHWASAVHWLVRSKLAGVGASGVDAATAYCPEIELAAALTLAIPAAVVVAVMHPAAAGTQAAPPLSVAVAPLMGAWKVTTAPGTAAPAPSRTSACSCDPNAAPTVPVCGLPACTWMVWPPSFVSVNLAGVETPETLVVTVKTPPVAFAVTLEKPEESVVALTLAPLELPFETVHDAPDAGTAVYVTVAAGMGLPAASRTTATRGAAYCVLIGAICGSVELPPLT